MPPAARIRVNHFKNSLILRLFKALPLQIKEDFLQQSIYCRMVAADLFLAMFWTTPSQLVLQLSRDNETPARSDFTLPHRNMSVEVISGE